MKKNFPLHENKFSRIIRKTTRLQFQNEAFQF